jgi:hypothetical protein
MLGSPIARHPVFPTPGLFFWDAVRDSLRFAEQFLKFIICIVVSNYKQLVFILYIYLVSELSILIGHFLAFFEAPLYPTQQDSLEASMDMGDSSIGRRLRGIDGTSPAVTRAA